MYEFDMITPEGTGDLMFSQCNARRMLSDCLTGMYRSRGYGEVKTPTIEFFNLFHCKSAYFPEEEMYKLIDKKGRLLVIRPDCTVPIARLVATRLQNALKPLRLYYNQNVLRVNPDLRGRSNEMQQVGVEVIGASSYQSDLEIIETAAHSLDMVCKKSGLSKSCPEDSASDFRVEICHIGFFKTLISALDVGEGEREQIRRYIEYKNFAMLNDVLEKYDSKKLSETKDPKQTLSRQASNALKMLPRLFGDKKVIRQAKELFPQDDAIEILDYLERLYDSLEQLGLSGKIIVDLGLVNQADYYTGVIFRGYLHGEGFEVLSGGRYDSLTEDFGSSLPATGFAIFVDRLAKQVLDKQPLSFENHTNILIHSNTEYMVEALKHLESMENSGEICEISLFENKEQSLSYAQEKGISEVHVVTDEIEILRFD